MQHAQTVKCSTPPSLCPTLVSFLIRKRTCSNAGTEQRAVIVFLGAAHAHRLLRRCWNSARH
jgi:hypothetical protein